MPFVNGIYTFESSVFIVNEKLYKSSSGDANKALSYVASDPADLIYMLDRGVKSSVMKNFNGDYSQLFGKLDILKDADIVFANLEGPASAQRTDKACASPIRSNPSHTGAHP